MALLAVLLASWGCGGGSTSVLTPGGGGGGGGSLQSIQHIVFLIKENRTFDNYFGTFPGADGATKGTISTGQVIPLGHTPDRPPRDIGHGWDQAIEALDGGKMDKFDLIVGCNVNGDYLCYTQLQQADIPNYWSYAQQFVLADRMFSSMHGPSFPNHLYTVAGDNEGAVNNPFDPNDPNNPAYKGKWGCDAASPVTVQTLDSSGSIVQKTPCYDVQTLADSLQAASFTWKYYAPQEGEDGYIWSSLDAINHIRNTSLWTTNVVPFAQFVSDAASGNLANVSWVITSGALSEHPPNSSCAGENTTVGELNALMGGPAWNSSVVFLTWDDYGGFYDHVPPPTADAFGFGARVPLLIISPFAKKGFVSHTVYELSSLLKFAEARFGLKPLAARDSAANDLMDSFDFTQTPQSPLILQQRQCP